MNIGIDATNVGGGGGITHLVEILHHLNPHDFNISKVYVFSSQRVLEKLPTKDFIIKYNDNYLNGSLVMRLFFQLFKFDSILKSNCDVLFSVTGDYIGSFRPVVGMSRNMLLYDRKVVSEINSINQKIKFRLSFYRQKFSFEKSKGVIFISQIAKTLASKYIDLENVNTTLIHHGISAKFSNSPKRQLGIKEYSFNNPFKFLYVSTIHMYKHQWNVVKAIGNLRYQGYPVSLVLVGGSIFAPAGNLLDETINEVDPKGEFVDWKGHIEYSEIQNIYKEINGIVFASTCENMPNILLESMYSGSAIACSNTQPMPEFLKEFGFYFDPHSVRSIQEALIMMLEDPEKRENFILHNQQEIKKYSWDKTSHDTFDFILSCFHNFNNNV
ncbi:glycosyltransferase [Algoriphagus lutimaris]|uniref:glycosyltransferase n=1 Tax=Algoriphagus lutimaris TaxID=613197 RepID=UPI00196AF3B0|nr:glycosyltransferase [Algoriphagus lutimaris]MBN3518828.1 glycosyltransferase [Algoriphagus lutimaris]